jgi:hypothetical protein
VTRLADSLEQTGETFGVLLVNRGAMIISGNQLAADILGIAAHEMITMSLHRVLVLPGPLPVGTYRLLIREREEISFVWVQSSPLLLDGLQLILLWPIVNH